MKTAKFTGKRVLAVLSALALLATALPAVLLPAASASAITPETELSATVTGSNLISNSGFENTTDGWTANGSALSRNTTITSTASAGIDGSYGLKVVKRTTPQDIGFYSDNLSVTGGATYEFGAWVRSEELGTDGNATASNAYITLTQSSGTTTRSATVSGYTDGWAKLSGIITVDSSTTTVSLKFLFDSTATNYDTWYVDNAWLYQTTEQLVTSSDSALNTTFDENIKTWALGQAAGDFDGLDTAAFRRDTEIKRTGNGSLYFGKDNLNKNVYVQSSVDLMKVGATAGRSYTWGMWLASHDSNAMVRMDVVAVDANGVQTIVVGREAMLSRGDTLSDWIKLATTAALPKTAVSAYLRLVVDAGRAQMFVDDVFFTEASTTMPVGTVTAGTAVTANELLAGYTYTASLAGTVTYYDLNGNQLRSAAVAAGAEFTVPSATVETLFTPSAAGELAFTQIATPTQDDAGWTAQVVWHPENEMGDGIPKVVFFRNSFKITKSVQKAALQMFTPNFHKDFLVNNAGGLLNTYMTTANGKLDASTTTVSNDACRFESYTYDLSTNLIVGTNMISIASYQSGDNNPGGLIWQMDVVYTDGTTDRFGTGLSNTTTTACVNTECGSTDPNVWYGNNNIQGTGWYKITLPDTIDTTVWNFVPAVNRGTPPLAGGLGSIAYNWDYNYITDRTSLNLSAGASSVSAKAGSVAAFVAPYTSLDGTLPSEVRARLYQDTDYKATVTVKLATDTTGADAGNGLLKASFKAPDYLAAGTYSLRVYESDLDIGGDSTLATVTLTAAGLAPITATVSKQNATTLEQQELSSYSYNTSAVADTVTDHGGANLPSGAVNLYTNGDFASEANGYLALTGNSYRTMQSTGTVVAGTTYNVSLYYWAADLNGGNQYLVQYYWTNSGGSVVAQERVSDSATGNYFQSYKGVSASSAWAEHTFQVKAPEGAVQLRLDIYSIEKASGTGKTGTLYIDDLCVYDPNIAPADHGGANLPDGAANLFSNGSFAGEANGILALTGNSYRTMQSSGAVVAGTTYNVSLYYWAADLNGGNQYLVQYYWTNSGGSVVAQERVSDGAAGNYFQSYKGVSESSAWAEHTFQVKAPEGAVQLRLDIYSIEKASGTGKTGTLYIDDLCVYDPKSAVSDHGGANLPNGKTNLVQNGDFANGTANWELYNGSGLASIADGMAKLTINGATGIAQTVSVEAGKTYVLSFYTWVTDATNMKTGIELNGAGFSWSVQSGSGLTSVTNGWVENAYTITPTESGNLWFRIRCAWGGVGRFYVDDVCVYDLNEGVTIDNDVILTIDGKIESPVMYLRPFGTGAGYYDYDELSAFAASGIKLYATYGGYLGDPSTTGRDRLWESTDDITDGVLSDTAKAILDEELYEILDINPQAMVMVNIDIDAPDWWKAANPDECYEYATATGTATSVSFASTKYREEASAVITEIMNYLYTAAPYRHRIFGIRLTGGCTYEWMMNGYDTNSAFDGSTPMIAALNEKLGGTSYTADAVKTAVMAAGNVTLISTETELSGNAQIAYAYNTLLSESVSDTLIAFAQTIKTACANNWIVGGYNGYLWNFPSSNGIGASHTSMNRVLSSEYVDFICSPLIYGERGNGHYPAAMAMSESVAAHGKLYFLEQDNRTHAARVVDGNANSVGKVDTVKQTVDQLARDLSIDLVKNNGFWTFDMNGGWFSHEAITARLAQIKNEYDISQTLNNGTNSEIAVIVGDDTYDYLANDAINPEHNGGISTRLIQALYEKQRIELAKLGTPYDTIALSDVSADMLRSYKLFIVLSPFGMTADQASVLKAAAADGDTILWVYMPGRTEANIEAFTGMTVSVDNATACLQATTVGLEESYLYGAATATTGPKVVIEGASNVLAQYNGGQTAAAWVSVNGYTSVYSAVPNVPAALLRKLCDDVDIHRYTEHKDAIVEANNSYVTVSSHVGGDLTILLPQENAADLVVYDVFAGKTLTNNGGTVQLTLDAEETALLRVTEEPVALTVSPTDHGGETALAAGQANLLSGGDFSNDALSGWDKNLGTASAATDGMVKFGKEETASPRYIVSPAIQAIPGMTYTLSFYYWIDNASAGGAYFRARVLSSGGTTNDYPAFTEKSYYDIHEGDSNGWKRYELTFTVPSDLNTSAYTNMRVWLYNSRAVSETALGDVYFDDVSLVAHQKYVAIDHADSNDAFKTIYYNTNMSGNNGNYSRDNVELTNDQVLTGLASSYYGLYAYLNDVQYSMFAIPTGTNNLYMYIAETYDDPTTTKMKSAADGSILVIPAGTKLEKATSGITVYFVQDFVLEKKNGSWLKKVTIEDHTTMPASKDGGAYVPPYAVGGNLVTNSAFATDLGGYGTNGKGLITRTDAGYVAFNGISGSNGNAAYDYLYFTPTGVQAGKTYELSYYVWITDATGLSLDMYLTGGVSASGGWLDQALKKGYNGTQAGSSANTNSLTATTGAWKRVTYQWTVPETATLSGMQIGIRSYGAGLSTFYLDDISLYEVESQFKGATLTLGDKLHMNYYTALLDSDATDKAMQVKFTYTDRDGAVTKWVPIAEAQEAGDYTVFTLTDLVAAYMATDIHAELGYGTENAFTVMTSLDYSVQDYAQALIDGGSYDAKVKTAAKALLNYGAATQTYFGYQTETLADSVLAEADKLTDINTALGQIDNINQYKATTTNRLSSFVGYTLLLTDGVGIRLYFTEQVTVTVDGETVNVVDDPDSDRYYAEISGVRAADLDLAHTVVVNGTMTIQNLSALTPARTVARSSSSTQNFRRLSAALILYAQSVNAL